MRLGPPGTKEHHCATLEVSLIYELGSGSVKGFHGVLPGREATLSKESGGK